MLGNVDPVRSVLIPIMGTEMLLPNSAIAEIINYQSPEEVDGAPDWVVGSINWRGRQLMLISVEKLMGLETPSTDVGKRISVLNRVNAEARQEFYAMVTAGIPHLVRLKEGDVQLEDRTSTHDLVREDVTVQAKAAFIPNMDYLEGMVNKL